MTAKEKIQAADLETMRVIHYPDPRLKEDCSAIEEVDDDVRALAARMEELMFEFQGVGLAAPQVGVTVRMFLASPTFQADDVHVYINPKIVDGNGAVTAEEGCLSFPGIYGKVKRNETVTIEATGLDGERFTQEVDGLHARICQHENDHLNGMLLLDRLGTVAKLANRKAIQALEEKYPAM